MGQRGLILALGALLGGSAAAAADCAADQLDLRGDWGQARFHIEIADTPDLRARGLMHRDEMARGAGMLFIYEREEPTAFWMRNTRIPLDMIFIDGAGKVVHVHHRAVPFDETPIPSQAPVRFVLEVNGGLAETFGIAPGSEIRHPSVVENRALWPCDDN